MRYKVILSLLLPTAFSLLVSNAIAQNRPGLRRMRGDFVRVDTIVVVKGKPRPAYNMLACSIPPSKHKVEEYRDIPLAGQKAYFGDMTGYVTSFVRKYLQLHNKTLSIVQDRGIESFSVIDTILAAHNVPKQLKYLAVIESALNHNAISHAGARGPWQLMAPTARLMGLTVSNRRDDRRDWNKSTYAAAKYLSLLYEQMNDWLLVIAAYNSGPGPVQRAIDRTGSHNFWDIKKYLPLETQGHVLAFIATASIFENLSKFIGINNIPADLKLDEIKGTLKEDVTKEKEKIAAPVKSPFTPEELKNMTIVSVNTPISLDLMASELAIDVNILRKWNPDYQLFVYHTYPSKDYFLHFPKDKLANFLQKKEFLIKKSKLIFSEMGM